LSNKSFVLEKTEVRRSKWIILSEIMEEVTLLELLNH